MDLNILEACLFVVGIMSTINELVSVHGGRKEFWGDLMRRFCAMGIGYGDREGVVGVEFGFEHGIVETGEENRKDGILLLF